MSAIRHCRKARKTVSYWLVPNAEEGKLYKHIILLAANCPVCGLFTLEWQGVMKDNAYTPQKRISHKKHDEWIKRTQTDLDDQMDSSNWKSVKAGVYRVKASLRQFPWTPIMATVR